MNPVNLIVLGVITLIIALAVNKIVKDKKRGVKCPGCGECCDSGTGKSCRY